MFVYFSCFLFASISATETTQNNNTHLKNQLQKSLSHVNEMLADIEGKIENERKILSQIDYDLNYKEQPGFMDYEVTDIWWQTTPTPNVNTQTSQSKPTVTKHEGAKEIRSIDIRAANQQTKQQHTNETSSAKLHGDQPSITDIVSSWVISAGAGRTSGNKETSEKSIFDWSRPTIPTPPKPITTTTVPPQTTLTSPIIPKETTTSSQGPPTGWPHQTTASSTADSIFVQDMKNLMALDQYGYFSTFITRILEMISVKDSQNVTPIISAIGTYITQLLDTQKLASVGDSLENSLRMLLSLMTSLRPERLQQQAGVAHYVMKHKNALASPEINAVFNYYDSLFTQQEGEDLYKALELFDKYPDGGHNATTVTLNMINALLAPFMRVEGTRDHRKLIRAINQAVQEMYPNWRAHNGVLPIGGSTNGSADQYNSTVPSRRSLTMKKIMRHFILKHPSLFGKSNRHHKHAKKNKKHRIHTKQHRRSHHRKYDKHGHNYEKLLKRKAYIESSHEQENAVDTSGSGAYYREPSKKPTTKKHKKEAKQLKKLKKHTKPNRKYSKHQQEKARHRLLKMIAPTEYSKNFNAKHLNELAMKFLRNKEDNLNYRRVIVEPSEEELLNKSDYVQSSSDNSMLDKIRYASSYSDEEDYLRTNLYDALRHGNRTFITFRAINDDIHNQTLRSLRDSSSGSDYEWILKNNIYKVFEQ